MNIIIMDNNIHNELEYLMSDDMYKKYMATQETGFKVDFINDKKFYRKRVVQLTKDLFKDNDLPKSVKNNFNNYIKHCVMYLKIVDKTDILQRQYVNIEERDLSKGEDISIYELDSEFLKSGLNPPVTTLDDYVIKTNTDAPRPPPQKKIVNLKTPELKNKGVKNRKKKKKDINK